MLTPSARKLIAFALLVVAARSATAQSCTVPELVEGDSVYNALVCDGIAKLNADDVAAAATRLRQASQVRIHAYPNFRVLPRLALAYHALGDNESALNVLDEAILSFDVFYGFARCRMEDDGYQLELPWRGEASSAIRARVVSRMCGEAFDAVYSQASTRGLLADHALFDLLAEAAATIRSKKP
jgi:hypothetical protein